MSTRAASMGRSTYWLAFEMVMGLTAVVKPPRMPATTKGAQAASSNTCDGYHTHHLPTGTALPGDLYNFHMAYTRMMNSSTRYQWFTISVPMTPARLFSFWNSLKTVVVVRRMVKRK